MATLTVTNLSTLLQDLGDFSVNIAPTQVRVFSEVPYTDIPRLLSLIKMWKAGTLGLSIAYTPEEFALLAAMPSRQEEESWVRDNVAASLVNDPMTLAGLTLTEKLMDNAGSVIKIK